MLIFAAILKLEYHTWLVALAADRGYSEGTGYEYAKVCRYALEWLAQNPVQLGTKKSRSAIPCSR
jgi:hypothetical protein